jgi:hypothetical protein
VLVAVAIVATALAAGSRAASSSSTTRQRLNDITAREVVRDNALPRCA